MFSKADRFNLRSRSFSGECVDRSGGSMVDRWVDRSMDQRCWWWLNRQAPRVVKQRKARMEHAQKGKVSVQDYSQSNPLHHPTSVYNNNNNIHRRGHNALTFFFGQIGKGEGWWIGFAFIGGFFLEEGLLFFVVVGGRRHGRREGEGLAMIYMI
jgi:hypothetical protein